MKTAVIVTVKGTYFYNVVELVNKKILVIGTEIKLEHDPNNIYDSNAVAIKIKNTGVLIGHIAMDIAPQYADYVNNNMILAAEVSSIEKNNGRLKIKIKVIYDSLKYQPPKIDQFSNLFQTANELPAVPGVYSITNNITGKKYIGSSQNIHKRLQQHIRNLTIGKHHNDALQVEFIQYGANAFNATSIYLNIDILQLEALEASTIIDYMGANINLYNKTLTGKGYYKKTNRGVNSGFESQGNLDDLTNKKLNNTANVSVNQKVVSNNEKHKDKNYKTVFYWITAILVVLYLLNTLK